jgi:purine nucleoside phosphorylase
MMWSLAHTKDHQAAPLSTEWMAQALKEVGLEKLLKSKMAGKVDRYYTEPALPNLRDFFDVVVYCDKR